MKYYVSSVTKSYKGDIRSKQVRMLSEDNGDFMFYPAAADRVVMFFFDSYLIYEEVKGIIYDGDNAFYNGELVCDTVKEFPDSKVAFRYKKYKFVIFLRFHTPIFFIMLDLSGYLVGSSLKESPELAKAMIALGKNIRFRE